MSHINDLNDDDDIDFGNIGFYSINPAPLTVPPTSVAAVVTPFQNIHGSPTSVAQIGNLSPTIQNGNIQQGSPTSVAQIGNLSPTIQNGNVPTNTGGKRKRKRTRKTKRKRNTKRRNTKRHRKY